MPIPLLNLYTTLSNKNNPQAQEYFSSLKDEKYQSSHFLAQTASLALFLEWHVCNAKGLKNAFQVPAQNPNEESEAKKRKKRKEHKHVAERKWLPPAPYGHLQMLVND